MNQPQAYGFLLVNKPSGPTSHDIVDELRKITKIKKIGHAGTLDPFAEGLLIMAIGRMATREMIRFVKLGKTYEAVLRLGEITETYDRTGKKKERVVSSDFISPEEAAVDEALAGFSGKYKQLPPMFSAKKLQGKKLYELARQGREVEREVVEVEIYNIRKIEYLWPRLVFSVSCSSGTYIRVLGFDIGCQLAGGAYLEELKRVSIGGYSLKDAVSLDRLNQDNWTDYLFWPA